MLARTAQTNTSLNAIVTLDEEGARTAATASEKRWHAGNARGPLDGVPLTVKDNINVRGMRTTWGSRLYADFVPAVDELPVARARAAGMVILGKTNVPEFTLHGYTDNAVFGTTRNPWDLRLTPGGSSGGAVASVAVGMSPLALATDGGGSIRRPASHTGVVGFKPSRGRVARADGLPQILLDYEVAGVIARTTRDARLLLEAIALPRCTRSRIGTIRSNTVARAGTTNHAASSMCRGSATHRWMPRSQTASHERLVFSRSSAIRLSRRPRLSTSRR